MKDLGPPAEPVIVPAELVDRKLEKLAGLLHMEWCQKCDDWRELGHLDGQDPEPVNVARILEEQSFPL